MSEDLKVIGILRLKSGEEIIGRILQTEIESGDVAIQDAGMLVPTPDRKITFMKWLDYTVEGALGGIVKIPNDYVAFQVTPNPCLLELYTRALKTAYEDAGVKTSSIVVQ